MGVQERIKEIEEEMARTQVNKATEYHLGVLKAKLAKLRRELIAPRGTGGGSGFEIKRSGDASIVLIGLPSVGKSTLLGKLTNRESKIAAYAFTTLTCIPGVMEYKGARIQILDLPGILEGAKDGKGRGREVIAVARNSDLIFVLVEAMHPKQKTVIENELYGFGIRTNRNRPQVIIDKNAKGGIVINTTVKLTKISKNEIIAALNEYRIFNANVVLRNDIDIDEFIDVLEGNREYIPTIHILTKSDLITKKDLVKVSKEYDIAIAAEKGEGIEKLKEIAYQKLNLINIFTKRKGEETDLEEPLVVRRGIKISEVCDRLHRDLRKEFRYAMVWGKSVKHQPQKVGLAHILADGDIIQIIKR
ncbi:GTP-binding protein [Candidatus Micrarchaeota archaeon]|nr:GTP-binding protein [Candidatus Micrarchaeota archaeon]MBU1166344.1 GTP-binding protein [Candidatus Micrarchaeota archaeon]MBU1886404.1 GTP-binding protein [Candidatus Micrarchaeota archaeon]